MSSQRAQLEATLLSRLQPKAAAAVSLPEQGELAGRRRDPTLFSLAIERIRPDEDQVRRSQKSDTDSSIQELAASIQAVGVLQPLDVRYVREADCYEIVAGERRYTAAKLAGLRELPVKLLDASEGEVRRLQILENIHRQELSPLELGTALLQLVEEGATSDELATLLSKSKSFITKALAIARNLSVDAKEEIGKAPESLGSMAHLYEVAQLPPEIQQPVLRKIATEGLTREQLQQVTAEVKQQARAATIFRGGRPANAKPYVKTIALQEATITIRFRRALVRKDEIADVLRKGIDSL